MVSPGLPVWCHLAQASCSIAARGGPQDSLGLMHMSLVGVWVCVGEERDDGTLQVTDLYICL